MFPCCCAIAGGIFRFPPHHFSSPPSSLPSPLPLMSSNTRMSRQADKRGRAEGASQAANPSRDRFLQLDALGFTAKRELTWGWIPIEISKNNSQRTSSTPYSTTTSKACLAGLGGLSPSPPSFPSPLSATKCYDYCRGGSHAGICSGPREGESL